MPILRLLRDPASLSEQQDSKKDHEKNKANFEIWT